jgi:hypothetical protein
VGALGDRWLLAVAVLDGTEAGLHVHVILGGGDGDSKQRGGARHREENE